MQRTLLHFFLIVVLVVGAFAQQKLADQNAPSAERLRAHVTYLASGKLEGRKTGSAGAEMAARYIADEFKRYGLSPGVVSQQAGQSSKPAASYLQSFPFVASVDLGKSNAMSFTPNISGATQNARVAALDLRLGEDWVPLGWSANARVENLPVTYVGYGIKATDLNHDDYAGIDVNGRIALAFAGTPDGNNPHGQFTRYNDLRFKAIAARDHGAKALIIIAREENFKDDRLSRLNYDNAASVADIPVAVISRQVARRALEAAATVTLPLDELEKAMSGTPASNHTSGGTSSEQQTPRKNFSAPLRHIAFTIATDIVRRNAPAANVIGRLEGSDPQLKNEVIVVGAHYDHLGHGGSGSLAPREGEVHHGADDNASGVAGLLELARMFSAERARPRRTMIFIAFGGEEEGLLGSNYYVNHPVAPLAQTVAMINLDMIGRLKDDRLVIGGVGTSAEWKTWIAQANMDPNIKVNLSAGSPERNAPTGAVPVVIAANGQTVATANPKPRFTLILNEDGYGPSDHSSFYGKQTPVLFFWTGTHEDYHKPSDTADRINYEGEVRIVSFVHNIIRTLDATDKRPTYTVAKSESRGRSTGFRVYLGTIPNYTEGTDGMKLDGVRDDSPAAKAGMKAGDRIVKMAGRDVRNVYDYTYALSEMKAGQEYEIEVIRGDERIKLKITPTARK